MGWGRRKSDVNVYYEDGSCFNPDKLIFRWGSLPVWEGELLFICVSWLLVETHGYKSDQEHFPFSIIMTTGEINHQMFLIEDIST